MASHTSRSLARRWEDYQPSKSILAWACAATAIATIVVGFSWGGWVTGGTSAAQAKTAGDVARSELASVICIDKFNTAPDKAAQLFAFKALADHKKRAFVEAGDWATMPGQTSPDRRGAQACAEALGA